MALLNERDERPQPLRHAVALAANVLSHSRPVFEPRDGQYVVTSPWPVGTGTINAVGKTPRQALHELFRMLEEFVFSKTAETFTGEQPAIPERRPVIGITAAESLHSRLRDIAVRSRRKISEVTRVYFRRGFEELDDRLDRESSEKLFRELGESYESFPGESTKQWMLRLEDQRLYDRALGLAHEYNKSLSELARIVIAGSLQKEGR
jgi:hypothetical protein